MTLQQMIESLEQDNMTYRNICAFKLKEIKDNTFTPSKKCESCDGYSSRIECIEYMDVKHLIEFFKRYDRSTKL